MERKKIQKKSLSLHGHSKEWGLEQEDLSQDIFPQELLSEEKSAGTHIIESC